MANPNVRRTVLIESNMERIAHGAEIEASLVEIRAEQALAYRHCRCAARAAHDHRTALAKREALLAAQAQHDALCEIANLVSREAEALEAFRAQNAALEAGAPLEAVA